MNKTYADSYRRRRSGKISSLMVFAAGILLWKYYRQTSSSQDAWTAAILRHVVDPEQSREEQKEQMKKAFRLAKAAGTTKQEMAQAYQHMAPEAFRFKKHQ